MYHSKNSFFDYTKRKTTSLCSCASSPPEAQQNTERISLQDMERAIEKIDNILSEIEKIKEETEGIRKEMVASVDAWNRSQKELEEKVNVLELGREYQDRKTRRNNIVIKGRLPDGQEDDEKSKVSRFLKENLQVNVSLGSVKKIREKVIMVELGSLEDKLAVMKSKSKLKTSDVFIENDMTQQERKIQWLLRQKARKERKRGKSVQVFYQKVKVDGEWLEWDPKSKALRPCYPNTEDTHEEGRRLNQGNE